MGSIYCSSNRVEISQDGGTWFYFKVYRETYIENEGKTKLIATSACEFPFDVTFDIEEGLDFDTYFTVSGPEDHPTWDTYGNYEVTVKYDVLFPKECHVRAIAKMRNADKFKWIPTAIASTKVVVERYVNFFTTKSSDVYENGNYKYFFICPSNQGTTFGPSETPHGADYEF